MNYSFKVTTAGRELLAAILATGKELEVTRAAIGSGKISEDKNLADMTDLIQYVAEGTIAQRRHTGNVLYLTVQYSSNSTPGLGAFYLAEFILQAKHPISGENTTIIYATLGDYTQPVNAYSETAAPDIRSYPMAIAISDEINVSISAPAGLVTYDDLQRAVDDACGDIHDELRQDMSDFEEYIKSNSSMNIIRDIIIPSEGWQPLDGDDKYAYYIDVDIAESKESHVPIVNIYDASDEIAATAKLSGKCQTFDGYLRFKAKSIPQGDINGNLVLISNGGGGASAYDLPVADENTLGGVKAGDIIVAPDGKMLLPDDNLSEKDIATEKEIGELIKAKFGNIIGGND